MKILLPIGGSFLEKIRSNDYVYIDKTRHIVSFDKEKRNISSYKWEEYIK